ncbi:anaphase-promoting complex subunit Hcn1 [Rhizoclosmatium sp. JEL0117]|nr:anaphase-promoting complex subunit Hcn1 [Rhizoclosmatium sp. JEL0117]
MFEKRTPASDDPIIAKLLSNRCAMTDVDAISEQERQKRMFIMLRWSGHYRALQVQEANSKYASDQTQTSSTTSSSNLDCFSDIMTSEDEDESVAATLRNSLLVESSVPEQHGIGDLAVGPNSGGVGGKQEETVKAKRRVSFSSFVTKVGVDNKADVTIVEDVDGETAATTMTGSDAALLTEILELQAIQLQLSEAVSLIQVKLSSSFQRISKLVDIARSGESSMQTELPLVPQHRTSKLEKKSSQRRASFPLYSAIMDDIDDYSTPKRRASFQPSHQSIEGSNVDPNTQPVVDTAAHLSTASAFSQDQLQVLAGRAASHVDQGIKWEIWDYGKPKSDSVISDEAPSQASYSRPTTAKPQQRQIIRPSSSPRKRSFVGSIQKAFSSPYPKTHPDPPTLPVPHLKFNDKSDTSLPGIISTDQDETAICILQDESDQITTLARTSTNSRAKEHWAKIRDSVVKKKSAQDALPEFFKLAKRTQKKSIAKPARAEVPYNTVTAWMHWLFLCSAFNEKGQYLSIKEYHKTKYRRHSFWVDGLNPTSLVCAVFGAAMICSQFFTLLLVPYYAAFMEDTLTWTEFPLWLSGFYVVDTMRKIITPQYPKRTGLRQVVKRHPLREWITLYIRENGFIDIITIIPWMYIITLPHSGLPLSLLSLLRTVRLPMMMSRNPFFVSIHRRVSNITGVGNMLARIIPVGVIVFLFIHFQACFAYYFGKLNDFWTWDRQFPHWVQYPGGVLGAGLKERYIWMFSQAVGNLFPMTFNPETIAEQLSSQIFVILGGILYAVFVGLISAAAIGFDASGRQYQQKIDELTEYLTWKNIDQPTKQKLLDYYEFKYRGKYFEEEHLLASLNDSLRTELACITCKELIEKVPFLKREMRDGRDTLYLGKIATALRPLYVVAGDYIIQQGETATDMYFLLAGSVNILVNGNQVAQFEEGTFFGEIALIADIPRTATVQAATSCNLYSLSAKAFRDIISEFDDMEERINQIYEERMAKVKMEQAAKDFLKKNKH